MRIINKIVVILLTFITISGYLWNDAYYPYTLAALIVYLAIFVFGFRRIWQLLLYAVFILNILAGFVGPEGYSSIYIVTLPSAIIYYMFYGRHKTFIDMLPLFLVCLIISESIGLLFGKYFGFYGVFGYLIFLHIPFKEGSEFESITMSNDEILE